MEKTYLLLAEICEETYVLGPGKRFAIWTQGCPFSCKGCIAPSMHSVEGGKLTDVDELAESVIQSDVEGITISGGEPFLQASELVELLERISKKKKLGVIVYTGFTYETLTELARENEGIKRLLERIDLLIDGSYIEEKNTGYGLKGSSNQNNLFLTERYKKFAYLYDAETYVRQIELHPKTNGTMMVGVPPKKVAAHW